MQSWWKNLVIEYEQHDEFLELKRDIFDYQIYNVDVGTSCPIIIDGGAHIGLATLYFKWLYPQARILAFEPNPSLFRLLQLNVTANNLDGVELYPQLLSNKVGPTSFYIDETEWQWWSVGSMSRGAWSGEQKAQKEIIVESVKIADIVKNLSRVDLLKLDIEGMEQRVLLSLKGQIRKVRHLVFEYHPTREQNLTQLLQFLRRQGFAVELYDRKRKRLGGSKGSKLILVQATNENLV